MTQVKYTIRTFDPAEKKLIVDFDNEGWAEILLTAPFPANKQEFDEVVNKYCKTSEQIDAAAAVVDLGFLSEMVGVQAEAPRFVLDSTAISGAELTPLVFIERFTDAEQLAIVQATMVNPQVKLWYDKLIAASNVVVDDPRLVEGMDALVTAGLITEARSVELLTK